ncbi:MAG: glycosyltransferase family 2 protein [Rhodobacterales bacterium]|jgi:glycosyltransferase involved in cell wall biosynthesis
MIPVVSVIIPVFQALGTIDRAVASIQTAGLPLSQVQIIIAPDDGQSYEFLNTQYKNITIVASDTFQSGAGPTRNRALQAAKGNYIAFLDADDTWEKNYLAAVLPLAQNFGAAFGSTSVLERGREILRLPTDNAQSTLSCADFARSGASFHPVVARTQAGPFVNQPSQDILHSLEILTLYGNAVPVSEVAYQLNLNPQSATAADSFSHRVADAYETFQTDVNLGKTRIPTAYHAEAVSVFAAKIQLNQAYLTSGHRQSYYQFIATWLAGQTGGSL